MSMHTLNMLEKQFSPGCGTSKKHIPIGIGCSLLGLLSLLSFGCAHIPTQELSEYRSAFAQVQEVSESILIDFAEAVAAGEARTSKQPTPALFSTKLNSFDATPADTIDVRRTALRAIGRYNNVLTTLAEGKSVGDVQDAAGGFVEAAGKFIEAASKGAPVPGLSSVVEIVKTLAGEFEKARLRAEFKKAVRNGAPIIDKMLVALIVERTDHITLRSVEANLRHTYALSETIDDIRSVQSLFKGRSSPASDDPHDEIQEALNAALLPMTNALNFPLPVKLQYGDKKPEFTAEQQVAATQLIARIRELVADYRANVAQFENLKSVLNGYGSMLARTRVTLMGLSKAIDKPQDFQSSSEELFGIAFTIKRDIQAYRLARRTAQ